MVRSRRFRSRFRRRRSRRRSSLTKTTKRFRTTRRSRYRRRPSRRYRRSYRSRYRRRHYGYRRSGYGTKRKRIFKVSDTSNRYSKISCYIPLNSLPSISLNDIQPSYNESVTLEVPLFWTTVPEQVMSAAGLSDFSTDGAHCMMHFNARSIVHAYLRKLCLIGYSSAQNFNSYNNDEFLEKYIQLRDKSIQCKVTNMWVNFHWVGGTRVNTTYPGSTTYTSPGCFLGALNEGSGTLTVPSGTTWSSTVTSHHNRALPNDKILIFDNPDNIGFIDQLRGTPPLVQARALRSMVEKGSKNGRVCYFGKSFTVNIKPSKISKHVYYLSTPTYASPGRVTMSYLSQENVLQDRWFPNASYTFNPFTLSNGASMQTSFDFPTHWPSDDVFIYSCANVSHMKEFYHVSVGFSMVFKHSSNMSLNSETR